MADLADGAVYNAVGVLQSRENVPEVLWAVRTEVLHDKQGTPGEFREVFCAAVLDDSPARDEQAEERG